MAQVVLLSESTVRPSRPTPQPCEQALSTIDQLPNLRNYVKQVYYYKPTIVSRAGDFPDQLTSTLKESLSTTLSSYYPLAGRLAARSDMPGSLFINCNDAGVPFREAAVECLLADWSCDLEPDAMSVKQSQLNYAGELTSSNLFESPFIKIQVTKFLCGSIALGYTAAEVFMDACTSFNFVKAWSEVHKTGKISMLPLFDTEILKPRHPPRVALPITDYKAQYETKTCDFNTKSANHVDTALPPQISCKAKLFTLTSEKITALVQEVRSGPYCASPEFQPTSFEAITGLVWKCMTQARQQADDEKTIYNYPLSLRENLKRWSPSIPTSYFGNAIYVATVEATVKDITEKHVSYAVQLVHKDIQRVSFETIKSTVDWMHDQMQKGLEIDYCCDLYSGKVVIVNSLHTFPIYNVDFGWGSPLLYSLMAPQQLGDGLACMLPTPQGGRNRYLLVSLPEQHLERLCSDPLFLEFATPSKAKLSRPLIL